MDREQNGFDANCETELSNLQKLIAEMIAYIEQRALSKQQESQLALQQSQHRLLKYKDLLLHEQHIDESELLLMYTELSKPEKAIAKLGVDALSIAIDGLDKLILS